MWHTVVPSIQNPGAGGGEGWACDALRLEGYIFPIPGPRRFHTDLTLSKYDSARDIAFLYSWREVQR